MEIVLKVELSNLIEGCKKRDPRCQKELFKAYYGKMFGVCLRYARCKSDAQDLVQDGFIKLFEKIDLYHGGGAFEGWMRRLFVNLCLDQIRKNKNSFLSYSYDEMGENLASEHDESAREAEMVELIGQDKILEEIQNLSPMYNACI